MGEVISKVAAAAQAAKEAQAALVEAVKAAKDEGYEVTLIADAAGVSRTTIYKWIDDSVGDRIDVVEALNDGLQVIALHGSKHGVHQALKALGAPHSAMVSRIKTVSLCSEVIRFEDLPEEELLALKQALHVAGEAQRYFDRHKKYPKTVQRLPEDVRGVTQ